MSDDRTPPHYANELAAGIYDAYRQHRIQNEPTPPSLWPPPWHELDQERRARFFAIARHVSDLCWAWHLNAKRCATQRDEALERERVANDTIARLVEGK